MTTSPKQPNWLTYFQATRPAFLSITAFACILGFTTGSWRDINKLLSLVGLLLALIAHGAANVINDYHDSLNGSDWQNTNRIYPFTGGSRLIQKNILSEHQIKRLAIGMFIIVIAGGLFVASFSSIHLLWIGVIGITIGWFYSAKPIALMSRGLWGEISLSMAWALITTGSYLLNHSNLNLKIMLLAMTFGIMVSTILFINQIPDISADRQAGKITLAVTSTTENLPKWYLGITLVAYMVLVGGILFRQIDIDYGFGLITLLWHTAIAHQISGNTNNPNIIKSCIIQTILAAHLFAIILITVNMLS